MEKNTKEKHHKFIIFSSWFLIFLIFCSFCSCKEPIELKISVETNPIAASITLFNDDTMDYSNVKVTLNVLGVDWAGYDYMLEYTATIKSLKAGSNFVIPLNKFVDKNGFRYDPNSIRGSHLLYITANTPKGKGECIPEWK
ncbi:hypothetical protein GX420_05800 [bacterium]|nr:hypothetical protein [bacterium]